MRAFFAAFGAVLALLLASWLWIGFVIEESERPRHFTPLEEAARDGDLTRVRRLLDAGADPNAPGEAGDTPLYFAARGRGKERVAVARLLISRGADVNRPSQCILHGPAYEGDAPMLRLLLESGADPDTASEQGIAPLHEAIYCGWYAGFSGKREIVRLLLDHGASIDPVNDRGETPLFLAADIGNVPVFHLLRERGANLKARGRDGGTLLHAAATSDGGLTRELLRSGFDINARDQSGKTPLHWAVYWGMAAIADDPRMADLLLKAGADANPVDEDGRTPLDWAERLQRPRVAAALRARGGLTAAQVRRTRPAPRPLL